MALSPKDQKKAKELKLKADQAYMAQKWKKALELYIEYDQETSDDSKTVQRIADLLRKLNMKQEAIDAYKRVAHIYSTQGFWAKAIAMSKIALDLDPSDISIQQTLSKMYASQGQTRATTSIPGAQPVATTYPSGISIAAAQPRSMEDAPQDSYMGNVIELSSDEPSPIASAPIVDDERTGEITMEVENDDSALGPPLDRLKGAPLFSQMSADELFAVVSRMTVRKFPAQSLVCEEGDLGRSMFIISEGWLEVFTRDALGKEMLLGTLRGGDFFGEFGLLTNGTRNASVRAKINCELLEITSTDFDVVANRYPQMWVILEEYLRKRMVSNILTKSEVFRFLSTEERDQLGTYMRSKKIKMGEVVTQQGSAGEEMYFIKSGTVIVTLQKEPKDQIVLGELGAGDYFGEVAMLTGKPRTAMVRAKTDCELFELRRVDAAKVFKANQNVLVKLRDKMNERAQDSVAAYQSYVESRTTLNLV